MRLPTFLLPASCGLLLCAATAAHAVDLTGNYTGKWSCKAFDGLKFKPANKTSTMAISQSGTTLAVQIDSPGGPFGQFNYNGAVIPNINDPANLKGEAVLIQCGTVNVPSPDEGEIVRATVKTKLDGKGTLKGLSIFEDDAPEVGTCKYSYKRQNTTDPGILACP